MFKYRITDGFLFALATQFNMKLTAEQGECIRLIAKYSDQYEITDVRKVAYMLATAWHESYFKPISEIRAKPGTSLRKLQDRYWNTGFYGRGYLQLTWENNYRKFSELIGADLVKNPDLVLVPDNAAKILVLGMELGKFTGVSLNTYFNHQTDWLNARKIINGTDQQERIAEAAKKIHALLKVKEF